MVFKVMPEDTRCGVSVVEHPMEPGRLVRPHTHAREDEISYVAEGQIGVRIGDREFVAGAGAWVLKPRGIPHTFWNAGPRPVRLLEVIVPGAMAHYFEKLGEILSVRGQPDEAKIEKISHEYDISYSMDWVPGLKAKYNLRLVGEPDGAPRP